MDIIPVIDIMQGRGVVASCGRRESYLPVNTPLCSTSDPVEISGIYKSELKSDKVYIADLDSITRKGSSAGIVRKIKEKTGLTIYLDMGINSIESLSCDIHLYADKIILATETISSRQVIEEALSKYGAERVVAGIDIKDNKLLSKNSLFSDPEEAYRFFFDTGVREFILLDISNVGTMNGMSRNIRLILNDHQSRKSEFIIGGGFRNKEDIINIAGSSVSHVLLGTALHNLDISLRDIEEIRALSPPPR